MIVIKIYNEFIWFQVAGPSARYYLVSVTIPPPSQAQHHGVLTFVSIHFHQLKKKDTNTYAY